MSHFKAKCTKFDFWRLSVRPSVLSFVRLLHEDGVWRI